MPTNKGITTSCLLCDFKGRSDSVKRHIRNTHAKYSPTENFIACKAGRVIVTVKHPYETKEIVYYCNGVCLDCGASIKNNQAKNHLVCFNNHVCKEKQERTKTNSANSTDSTDSTTVSTDSTEVSVEVEPVDYKQLVDDIIHDVTSIKIKGNQGKTKEIIRRILRDNISDQTDDCGVTNYKDVLELSFAELSRLLIKSIPE